MFSMPELAHACQVSSLHLSGLCSGTLSTTPKASSGPAQLIRQIVGGCQELVFAFLYNFVYTVLFMLAFPAAASLNCCSIHNVHESP